MPDVPTHHVGDGERSLHHRADGVALLDVVPVPGLGAAAAGRRVLGLDGVDLVVGVVRRLDGVVLLLLPGLAALGADHQPVLPRQHRAVVVAEDVGRPLVHRPIGELARLVEHRHQRVAAPDPVVGSQRCPPLARAGRVEGVHTAQRVTLHQVALVVGDRGDLVLADQRVAAHQRWRRDRTAPDRRGRRTRDRSRAGCRRRRPRPRCGTCPCWVGSSADGASTVRVRRCGRAGV